MSAMRFLKFRPIFGFLLVCGVTPGSARSVAAGLGMHAWQAAAVPLWSAARDGRTHIVVRDVDLLDHGGRW